MGVIDGGGRRAIDALDWFADLSIAVPSGGTLSAGLVGGGVVSPYSALYGWAAVFGAASVYFIGTDLVRAWRSYRRSSEPSAPSTTNAEQFGGDL